MTTSGEGRDVDAGGRATLQLATLHDGYSNGTLTPVGVVRAIYRRIAARGDDGVWITVLPQQATLARAADLEAVGSVGLPLYGLPFAVKDNIDVAGVATTAAWPQNVRPAAASATIVRHLEAVGAICIGKTNLDQFATGLTGTRSPYGVPISPADGQRPGDDRLGAARLLPPGWYPDRVH